VSRPYLAGSLSAPPVAFSPDTFAARRAALARALGSGLAVIPGNGPAPMNYAGNVYAFRQDGTFRYYAGLDDPGLVLLLDADSGEATLAGHDPTVDDIMWEGPLPTIADRAASAGIAHTAAPDAVGAAIGAALAAGRTVHTLPAYRGEAREQLAAWGAPSASEALIHAVIAQRLVKTPDEIAEIEEAVGIAREMHVLAMRLAQPGTTEAEVAGRMEGLALQRGSHPSFPIILTRRGEVLHNHATRAPLQAGDLMLSDAGAVAPGSGYAADITRTAPVGGRFSERQRMVYDTVLSAQEAAIGACRPGVPFADVHRLAALRLTEGLVQMGLLRGAPDEIVAAGAHALFFPHGLGHAMGLDVHDMEALGEDRVGYGDEATRSAQFGTAYLRFGRPLREGHVMTVEPGLYFIDALMDQWAAERRHEAFVAYDALDGWRGTGGVRIEDDIVVTGDGCRVLGPPIPKRAEDVEVEVQAGA